MNITTKDNRCKAIISINLFALATTGNVVLYKYAKPLGVEVTDFIFLRCCVTFLFAIPALIWSKKVPFWDEPKGSIKWMIVRLIFSLTNVGFMLWSASLI